MRRHRQREEGDRAITEQLRDVTSAVQDLMQQHGWRPYESAGPGRPAWGAVRRDRPTPRDITHGWCATWAALAAERVGGRIVTRGLHTALELDGRFYDAESPEGVASFELLAQPPSSPVSSLFAHRLHRALLPVTEFCEAPPPACAQCGRAYAMHGEGEKCPAADENAYYTDPNVWGVRP